ncbi:MAG TPA: bifunctional riboflavin kinase/FAD synthetase [Acidimicrobiales bacterium]|nr:bifunctional riboflavin kinase/FAD synthetase [Acidimicrobiales bacterium]
MDVLGPGDCPAPPGGTAVTIGAYDGVHLGHRYLLSMLRDRAAARGLRSAVVTFDRHPATVVRPESAPALLTDLDQKLELLADCGIDLTLVVPFDRDRADETAEDFVNDVLVRDLEARLVVVGQDFHFGHGRKGNVALLAELGSIGGFDVEGVSLADAGGAAISSTRIRQLVAAGDVAAAATLLGRYHQIRGVVAHGDGRGGVELGFPTANVAVPPAMALPGLGIYAGWYRRPDGAVHPAAISVGNRPTFYERAPGPLVEAYLLDFDGDLYDQPAQVSFVQRLRDELRFDRVDDLVAQMHRDVIDTRQVLKAAAAP